MNATAVDLSKIDMGRRADRHRWTLPAPGHGLVHTLVSGKTGSGKSSTVAKLVGELADRPDIAFIGVDFKAGLELLPWAPRFTTIASNADQCDELLPAMVDFVERRAELIIARSQTEGRTIRKWEDDMGPRVVFLVDEGREMTYSKDAILALDSIAARSRAVGVNVVVATQYALAKDFPSTLLANLDHRICHRMGTSTQYAVALGVDPTALKEAGVEPIPTDQRGVCYVSGVPGTADFMRCRADYVPDEAIDRRAAGTAHLRIPPDVLFDASTG